MKVILDTNVFISGVFFGGPPSVILQAWRDGEIRIVVSPEILAEYGRVSECLHRQHPAIDLAPFMELLTVHAEIQTAPRLRERVCEDADDDKFIACALASESKVIVSGDKHLLAVSGYRGVEVMSPRQFRQRFLQK